MNINEGIKRISLLIKALGVAFALFVLVIAWDNRDIGVIVEKQDIGVIAIPIAVYAIFHFIAWVVEGFTKD
jgi:hypothetical protein